MVKNYIENLMETIYKTPLWVQEIVLVDLKKHLEDQYNGGIATLIEREVFTAYVPKLTFKGKKELETREHGLDANIYKCFSAVSEGTRIIDITLNNFWSLEETASYLAFGLENEYIQSPETLSINAAIFYIGNKIRLGEYIKRLKKIDIVQLDDVLRKQKESNSLSDSKKKIGEILLEMGLVAKNDIDAILCIKEDAQRRCVIPTGGTSATSNDSQYAEMLSKINKLTQENNLLKEKLRAIFNIQNKK